MCEVNPTKRRPGRAQHDKAEGGFTCHVLRGASSLCAKSVGSGRCSPAPNPSGAKRAPSSSAGAGMILPSPIAPASRTRLPWRRHRRTPAATDDAGGDQGGMFYEVKTDASALLRAMKEHHEHHEPDAPFSDGTHLAPY